MALPASSSLPQLEVLPSACSTGYIIHEIEEQTEQTKNLLGGVGVVVASLIPGTIGSSRWSRVQIAYSSSNNFFFGYFLSTLGICSQLHVVILLHVDILVGRREAV